MSGTITPEFASGFFSMIAGLIARAAPDTPPRAYETREFHAGVNLALRLAPAITSRVCVDLIHAIEASKAEEAA